MVQRNELLSIRYGIPKVGTNDLQLHRLNKFSRNVYGFASRAACLCLKRVIQISLGAALLIARVVLLAGGGYRLDCGGALKSLEPISCSKAIRHKSLSGEIIQDCI